MTSLLTRCAPPRAEHLTFTVYTRAQCCCCHKALDVLKDAQQRFGFAIEEVDIDGDPDLVAQFDMRSPWSRSMAKCGFGAWSIPRFWSGSFGRKPGKSASELSLWMVFQPESLTC